MKVKKNLDEFYNQNKLVIIKKNKEKKKQIYIHKYH